MQVLGIILIVYGIFCMYIAFLKPPFIWNLGKLKIMRKMMGEKGLLIFLIIWGAAAIIIGSIIR
ncbi:MAG: hypothetical protein KJ847_06175 [Firmicutes bacterium]|nr:hypothetical protein [Bacillota bacterium]